MSQALWTAVDHYTTDLLLSPDPVLEAAVRTADQAGLPSIAVSPVQGKFLFLLAKAMGARRILEIGTLGGYSGIWLARALPPGGRLITLELDPAHTAVARTNFLAAGLASAIELRLGPARDSLQQLATEGQAPFDLVFIDADKPGYPDYLRLIVPLCRPGSLIVADNVVRDGAVADAGSDDPNVRAVREFNALLASDPRLSGTVLQTVGVKGYDGLAIALVRA